MSASIVLFWIASAISFYLFHLFDYIGVALSFVLFLFCVARGNVSEIVFVGAICVGCVVGYIIALKQEFISFSTVGEASTKVYSFIFGRRSADRIAEYIYTHFTRFTSHNAAAFFSALITGRREFIPLALQDIIRRSGISHLLALSGFHLSVLFILASSIKVFFPRRIFEVFSIILVWIYCLWIGFIPSLWRAAIMYTVTISSTIMTGIKNFSTAWSIAGITMIFASSDTLYSPGFVLSMLALCGVVWGGNMYTQAFVLYFSLCIQKIKQVFPILWKNKNRKLCIVWKNTIVFLFFQFFSQTISKHVSIPFSISLGAAGATALYSFFVFDASYPIGIVTSVLLTPVVVVFMFLGIGMLALHCISQLLCTHLILKNSIFILQCFLGNTLSFMSNGINRILSYASHMFAITTVLGVVVFYMFLIGILVPYIFFYIKKYYRKDKVE